MKLLVTFFLFLLPLFTFAQKESGSTPPYPQDYFRNPLDIPIFLAGNFGECRPGHFHSGVDIKTLGKENQPVHAAADGYISRIKMEKGGFGHGIYITHPNGYTTLYAHLNKFAPAIQEYVVAQQYSQKRWDVDLQLSPSQFPVTKGQQIAWSGNTGASTAPHLHFEIRNTKTEHPLNPELFGLPIVDNIAPVPAEIAFYNEDISDGRASIFPLVKKGRGYIPAQPENKNYRVSSDTVNIPSGTIGIGINVDDHMEGSDNTIAFYTAELYVDDTLQAKVTLDDIGYDETRYINAYTDYETKKQHGKWIQRLYELPGNHLDRIYNNLNGTRGQFRLLPGAAHKAAISIKDDKGNESLINFCMASNLKSGNIVEGHSGFIRFYANKQNIFLDSNVVFTLSAKDLYDDTWFRCETIKDTKDYSNKFKLGQPWIPVHNYFDLHLKPNRPIAPPLRSKVVMMYTDDKDTGGQAAALTDSGWCKARVRNFGTYWVAVDTVPPTIKSMQKNGANLGRAQQITFEVKDNMTSVKKFSGYLDGKWICFEQHENLFFYKFDNHCAKGKHTLVFTAEDENGNAQGYHLGFTR